MSAAIDQSSLMEFFAAYFHEDWQDVAETTAQVVTEYLRAASAAASYALADRITNLAQSGQSNAELELDCYYEAGR